MLDGISMRTFGEVFTICAISGTVAAVIAGYRGWNPVLWFAIGLVAGPFGVVGIIVASSLDVKPNPGMYSTTQRYCPACRAIMPWNELFCPYCKTGSMPPSGPLAE
jgi:hypothetical protein